MTERIQGQLGPLNVLGVWLAFAVSLTTLGTVLWKGGAIAQTVDTNCRDIEILKAAGSPSLKSHEAMDNERISNLNERLKKMEDACATFTLMQRDLAEVKTALQFMSGQRRAVAPDGTKPNAGGFSY